LYHFIVGARLLAYKNGHKNMSASSYDELLVQVGHKQVGHKIVCVQYGVVNVVLECETCGEELMDFDKSEAHTE
jgi:hypothetical protein